MAWSTVSESLKPRTSSLCSTAEKSFAFQSQMASYSDVLSNYQPNDYSTALHVRMQRFVVILIAVHNFYCTDFMADWSTKVCYCAKKKFLAQVPCDHF